jgi:putative RecB family exonuclease
MIGLVDAPAVTTPATVSATRLNTWLGCRLRYYFKYVLRLKKPKSAATYVGSTVHAVLKQWNRARWRKEILTTEQLEQLFGKNVAFYTISNSL